MRKFKIAIVGAGKGGNSVLKVLREMNSVQIAGVADVNENAPGMLEAKSSGIYTSKSVEDILSMPELDIVIEATGLLAVRDKINQLKRHDISVIDAQIAKLFMTILEAKAELLEVKKIKGELMAVLNSVHEPIEVADNSGVIKYVNPAFAKVTGIPEVNRIGKNIFDVSPNGALAQALLKREPISGYRTTVGGSGVEVISNASPIMVDREMIGAVVVFQPVTDYIKLLDELKRSNIIIENLYAKIGQISGSKFTFDDLVGSSKLFNATVDMGKKAARSEATVLITGEPGTGKEIYAHSIHRNSTRSSKPFITINCSYLPESVIEHEIFGYEKGAFTGAYKTKLGKAELANEGILFLDEVAELNSYMQAKLLRLLQDGEFERVGSEHTYKVNVRVIASTNRNLKELVRKGMFREDLFFKLSVIEIHVPPLRSRKGDIKDIALFFVNKYNRRLGKNVQSISPEALQLLLDYEWPGNVREVESVIERAMVNVDDATLNPRHLVPYIGQFGKVTGGQVMEVMPLDKMEQLLLKAALSKFGDTLEGKKKAAKALNISLATLYNKLKKYKANLT